MLLGQQSLVHPAALARLLHQIAEGDQRFPTGELDQVIGLLTQGIVPLPGIQLPEHIDGTELVVIDQADRNILRDFSTGHFLPKQVSEML